MHEAVLNASKVYPKNLIAEMIRHRLVRNKIFTCKLSVDSASMLDEALSARGSF